MQDTNAQADKPPEKFPFEDFTREQLIEEVKQLSVGYANKITEGWNLKRQNDLFQNTIIAMMDAVSVLRGGKGEGVARNVFGIVERTIGKIKSGDYSITLGESIELVQKIAADETLPVARIKAAVDADVALQKLIYLIAYSKLSDEDKAKVDKAVEESQIKETTIRG